MGVLVVQGAEGAGDVGVGLEVGVGEGGVALLAPPEPVLDDEVEGHVLRAVLVGDVEQLLGGGVAVLGLDEAVGPLAEEGRVAGEVAVVVDEGVEVRAVEDVVIDAVGGLGGELELAGEAVIHADAGGGVPEDTVAVGREQQRDGDVAVGLRELDGGAAVVEDAGLVLAEAVEAFEGVGQEAVADGVGGPAGDGGGRVAARLDVVLLEHGLAGGVLQAEGTGGEVHADGELGGVGAGAAGGGAVEDGGGLGLAGGGDPGFRVWGRGGTGRGRDDVEHAGLAEGDGEGLAGA